ncbi:MAG: glycerol kinase [Gaiellaceae bacterium MAG52_C11]|nr:glycerol kinase [Candidatus Gaiellasilicea maunaloa]
MLLAIDQGTTGTTCLVVDETLAIRGRGYRELTQHFPAPGLVEHDADEIWRTVLAAAEAALANAGVGAGELRALGIANQRETTVLWDRATGQAVARALVWQDRRTAARCTELPAELIRERTGLVPDPYFSATKLEWLLGRAESVGDLAFGTVDSWLAWKLTGEHVTDVSNASRTMLLDLDALAWDDELLALFSVPRSILPEIVSSSGELGDAKILGASVPLAGLAGDQQAALFGQACFAPGRAKVTYGTGAFVLANAGAERPRPAPGVLATVAWRLGDEPVVYALEGSVFVAGAAIQWLRDGLGLIEDAAETEALARSLPGNDGVHFVPALTGLGSPHWRPDARGLICGLTRGTRREHFARAALEAIAFQTSDVLTAMELDLELLHADGGAAANAFLLQFQADVARVPVEVPAEREATALGAAALAGLGVGVWVDTSELEPVWRCAARYEPELDAAEAERLVAGWHDALQRTLA